MSERQRQPRAPWRLDLVEIAAIVVGYGLAALLFRAFWPSTGVSVALGAFAVGFYLWLGLAMSGPLLLVRKPHPSAALPPRTSGPEPATILTWAEMAWLVIGVYWIVLGAFVLPVHLHRFRMGDTVLFGIVPLAASLVLRLFGPGAEPAGGHPSWTHRAAVALILTWPLAWLCLIVLADSLQ